MARFWVKRSLPISYEEQGLIFFTCKTYKRQPAKVQQNILEVCRKVGGNNAQALFEYLTTKESKVAIMRRHFIASETTMDRMVRRFYLTIKL